MAAAARVLLAALNSINKSQSQFIVVDVFDGRRVETSDENTSTRTTESGNAILAVSGHTPVLRNDRHARPRKEERSVSPVLAVSHFFNKKEW